MSLMSYEELRKVAGEGIPVIYENKVHGYRILGQITAIIESYSNGCMNLRAELKDIHSNSVCICSPEELSIWNGYADKSIKR